MQPGSNRGNHGNNTHATDFAVPIDIDQRSIASFEVEPPSPVRRPTEIFSHGLASSPEQSYLMGQSASTPNGNFRNERDSVNAAAGASRENREANENSPSTEGSDAERAAATYNIRRSRRLRNHLEHFTRLGERLTSGSSSGDASSGSSGTRSRPSLRVRARSVRFSNLRNRSRSPSPNRGTPRHERRRTMPTISSPIPLMTTPTTFGGSSNNNDDRTGSMDFTPSESEPLPPPPPPPPQTSTPGPVRRSRLSRVRNSISSWPNIPDFSSLMSSRPPSRRPSVTLDTATTPSTAATSAQRIRSSTSTTTMPDAPTESQPETSARPESPTRAERSSSFGHTANNLLDTIRDSHPARVRPGEDQAAMLSRLLSVAAAATAASLVGNAEEAITQAQDVGGDNGGDGSFESFLRALQNGRLEAALRNGGNEMGGGAITPDSNGGDGVLSLNFFRMFRFGSTPASGNEGENNEGGESPGESNRMVPVIIVGIRSVSPRDPNDGGDRSNRPAPFFDALANLPVNIPTVPRRSRFGSSSLGSNSGSSTGSAHRRAASLGTPSRATPSSTTAPEYDSGSNPFAVPSVNTDTPPGPNPPPTTPADPTLPSFPSNSFPSYRRSMMDPITDDTDGFHTRDPSRRRLPRRRSISDATNLFGSSPSGNSSSGESSSRDRSSTSGSRSSNIPTPPEGTRSWIIYVLGGSYPENHPILTTPSLFTDEPTYEDMTLLSSLLGPAKLPVADREDLESAGGLFTFNGESAEQYGAGNVERCLVCLSDYEIGEECRKLVKCSHIFHRECIDEWLTTGRNSCPLCRGEGVEEKSKNPEQPTPPDVTTAVS